MSQDIENKEKNPKITVRDRRFWQSQTSDDATEQPSSSKPAYVEVLEQQIKDKEQAYTELAAALRAQREEHKAIKERLQREQENSLNQALVKLIEPLLEVIDNLELCRQNIPVDAALQATRDGMQLITNQFQKTLQQLGVEKINTVGQAFNPDLAEAIATSDCTEAAADNTVLEEYRSGYRLKDKLIRPARVRVAKWNANQHVNNA